MSQFVEMFGNPLSLVQRYPLKKLGDCCELNPRRPNLSLKETDKVSFVPMPSVSENGYLQDVTDEEYGKVKKGFTYFESNDVVFAKITPCMENGKGAIAEGLTNNIGMGSTEFHVLRPIEGVSSPYWLLALTRLPIFRERASKNMTGTGGQKRVPANYLENFMVGLPPIEEQNRFENIYKQADKSEFVGFKSQFIEMFKTVDKFKSLCELCRPKQWPTIPTKDFTEEGFLVFGANGVIGRYSQYNHEMPTILMACRGASCGTINISQPKSYITGNAMCMDNLDCQISFEYLAYFLSNYDYKTIITGGAQPQITVTNLQKVMVPVPDKDSQEAFCQIYKQADKSELLLLIRTKLVNYNINQ